MYIKSYVCTVPTPTVTISPPGPLREKVGDPLSINCTVRTLIGVELNAVMIMWLDTGGNLVMVDDRVTINDTTAIDNQTFFSGLSFEFLMEGDYGDVGNYTCNVMIMDASASDSLKIQEIRGQYTLCYYIIQNVCMYVMLQYREKFWRLETLADLAITINSPNLSFFSQTTLFSTLFDIR